jgi:hypothetical protein
MSKFTHARLGLNAQGLYDFCEYIKSKYDISQMTLLEIGSYLGESAEIFAQYFKSVHCIDPWTIKECIDQSYNVSEVEAEFDRRAHNAGNIIKTKGFSSDVVGSFTDKSFDVIYIDGGHGYHDVCQDIKNYLPKSKVIISGHDYGGGGDSMINLTGLILAVNELIGLPDKVFQDYSWIKEIGK